MVDGEPKREHTGGVLGVTFGLVLLLGLLAMLALRFVGGAVDGPAKIAEFFGEKPVPFELELSDAVRLPTGDVLVRLERRAGASASSAEPCEVILIEYRSPAAVAPLFHVAPEESEGGASARKLEWDKEHAFAWHHTLKKEEIAWGAWSSSLLVERAFREGGGWQDSARVDLSREGRALVLFAQWPDETPVDESKLKELLGALALPSDAQPKG